MAATRTESMFSCPLNPQVCTEEGESGDEATLCTGL